jgi:hypothetical protein
VRGDVQVRELRRRGAAMLEEALSCGRHADVLFELDDGTKLIGGHRAVMCTASKEFAAMFCSGMQDEKMGVVRMWVYLGEWSGVMMTLPQCVL